MNKKEIHWGIIGLGWMADRFLQDFSKAPGGIVTAVGSRSLDKAQAFKDRLQLTAAKVYGSYLEVCEDPDVDLVYITTPHNLHMENTIMALEAGKAVLCEKPLAVNLRQVERMITRARQKKLFLMEAMWTAFLPVILKTKKLIAENTIGTVKRINMDFSLDQPWNPQGRIYNPDLAGGALLDIGVYPVFLAQYLLNDKPEAITALARLGDTGVDEHTLAILKYPGDRFAQAAITTRFATSSLARIIGTAGAIHIPKFWMASSAEIVINKTTIQRIEAAHSYHYQASEVHKCLQQGLTESPVMPLKLSARVIETMDFIRSKIGLKYPFEE